MKAFVVIKSRKRTGAAAMAAGGGAEGDPTSPLLPRRSTKDIERFDIPDCASLESFSMCCSIAAVKEAINTISASMAFFPRTQTTEFPSKSVASGDSAGCAAGLAGDLAGVGVGVGVGGCAVLLVEALLVVALLIVVGGEAFPIMPLLTGLAIVVDGRGVADWVSGLGGGGGCIKISTIEIHKYTYQFHKGSSWSCGWRSRLGGGLWWRNGSRCGCGWCFHGGNH